MRTPGKKVSKKISSPQPQQRERACWRAPNINYPRQTCFCRTKEEFHVEYGLSLEGVNPRYLSSEDIPECQWLSVFTQKHLNNEKVHLKSVRPEFLEECALLYHKVYQTTPPNYEITIKFARGFAFERCTLAKNSTQKAKYIVAWAAFAESVIENVTIRRKLVSKMAMWKVKNGTSTSLPPSLTKQDSFEASPGCQPSSSDHTCSQYDPDQLMNPPYSEQVEVASNMLVAAKGKLKQKEKLVLDCIAALDEAKTRRDKAEGVRSAADALKQKISRAQTELQNLEGENLAQDEALLWRLKAEIMGCKVALNLLGPDVCASTLDKDVEELQDLHNRLLKEVESADAQFNFVNHLVKLVQKRQVPSLEIAPPAARVSDKGTMVISNECVACGLSLEDNEVVGVYMLPCRHAYHPICFAIMCCSREDCVYSECNQNITTAARKMVLKPAPMFLQQNLLEGKKGFEAGSSQSIWSKR